MPTSKQKYRKRGSKTVRLQATVTEQSYAALCAIAISKRCSIGQAIDSMAALIQRISTEIVSKNHKIS